MSKAILVVGVGSIGKRHIGQFSKYYKSIDVVDTRNDRLDEVSSKFRIRNKYKSYIDAIKNNKYEAIIICTPPHLHLNIATHAVNNNINLFIEKPLGINSSGWKNVITKVKKKKLINYVAFCHRHISYTKYLKKLIDKRIVGNIININLRWGSYLPDWHPYEDYRTFYMAKKKQGGGALLDESHGIDLVRHFFGEVKEVYANVGNYSDLEISSDDNAFLTFIFKKNIIAHLNFDLVSRYPRVSLEIVGSKGTLIWDRVDHQIKVYKSLNKKWQTIKYTKDDLMKMYDNQTKHFINCLKLKEIASVDISDALKTQKIIDASFKSSSKKKVIKL
mgnify:CR=1 FL=1